MATQQISFLIPPYGTATLSLPELLTPDAFARLDSRPSIRRSLSRAWRSVTPPRTRDPSSSTRG
jgi:hypothetical protein